MCFLGPFSTQCCVLNIAPYIGSIIEVHWMCLVPYKGTSFHLKDRSPSSLVSSKKKEIRLKGGWRV